MSEPDAGNPEVAATANCRDADSSRRRWLAHLSLAVAAIPALLLATPVVGFVVAPLFRKVPRLWRTVGKLHDFAIGETVAVQFDDASPLPWSGLTARSAAYLRRQGDRQFEAFSVNCAHLGCPVRWRKDAQLFMCPCHGGVYYANGEVAAGPPPHGLSRYAVRVVGDTVELQTGPLPIT